MSEKSCITPTDECVHLRRCFITGEYCSKQSQIQKERKELHGQNNINAFVIMNFSDMSDVVYKWRIKPFVESLAKYFYIYKNNSKTRKLCCVADTKTNPGEEWERVNKIKVIRADSDPGSNYVICNRICQQMQTADLMIVDVSLQNKNVFYEFGMAVAMGKLILPICYSESFYKMQLPEETKSPKAEIEHHIGCYPWRKALFEYYGVKYRDKDDDKKIGTDDEKALTRYLEYDIVREPENHFDDVKYDRFPYHEDIEKDKEGSEGEKIGKIIYEKLKDEYNRSKSEDNTLIVYTMDGFRNAEEAGRCIVNFYDSITWRMKEDKCFGGDRVGVLVQYNVIPDSDKDADKTLNLFYNVAEIIHIGLNQATYYAANKKIRMEGFLEVPEAMKEESLQKKDQKPDIDMQGKRAISYEQKQGILRHVKEYISNRGLLIYPNNPIYVNRLKNELQEDVKAALKERGGTKPFCLYHVMLKTLCYVNEIVVDLSKNCLQSIFWLGAAHGADVYAITVRHEDTDKERKIVTGSPEKHERNIFDVSGLWTAILRSNRTDEFCRQLALAQLGIERHTGLAVRNEEDEAYSRLKLPDDDEGSEYAESGENEKKQDHEEKEDHGSRALESYYRKRFWNRMLRYNSLRIYLPERDEMDKTDHEPRLHIIKWDMEAVAELSHYLSKRTVIGEYWFASLKNGESDEEAETTNFISIGEWAKPLGKELSEYIYEKIGGNHELVIYKRNSAEDIVCRRADDSEAQKNVCKGFKRIGEEDVILTWHPVAQCSACTETGRQETEDGKAAESGLADDKIYNRRPAEEEIVCKNCRSSQHAETAQLLLWREVEEETRRDDTKEYKEYKVDRTHYRVSMIGSSGPATLALSSLLVDRAQKKEILKKFDNKEGRYLLCGLQKQIREQFMKVYLSSLDESLEDIFVKKGPKVGEQQKTTFCSLVRHSVALYLSAVLYRYFLPFLSEQDITRLCNGMKAYVTFAKAGKVSPFVEKDSEKEGEQDAAAVPKDVVAKVVEEMPKVLEGVLKRFKGVEAFYKVDVRGGEAANKDTKAAENQDTRIVCNIGEIKSSEAGKEIPRVNCLFEKKETIDFYH